MKIYINKYLTRLLKFSVKGSTSKRSWLVYHPFLTEINEIIKCNPSCVLNLNTTNNKNKNKNDNNNHLSFKI